MAVTRPRHPSGWFSGDNRLESEAEFESRLYAADKRAETAHADRLAATRLEALRMSYEILKQEPGTFSLDDVKRLADQLVDYAREGNQPTDGTPLNRFHGK